MLMAKDHYLYSAAVYRLRNKLANNGIEKTPAEVAKCTYVVECASCGHRWSLVSFDLDGNPLDPGEVDCQKCSTGKARRVV
jgi:hypothetical protein